MASLKLKGGGYVKLDIADYDRVKDYIFYACEINTKAGPRMVIKSDELNCKYLHCTMFNDADRRNKTLLHIDGNIFNYERRNIVLVPSNRRKKVILSDPECKDYYYCKTPTVVGVIENKCTITPDNDRELICATCSYLDLERYEICLDVAAKHSFPGWRILQLSDWCTEIKEGLTTEEQSRSYVQKVKEDIYEDKKTFSKGDVPFCRI